MPHPTRFDIFARRLEVDELVVIAIAVLLGVLLGWGANAGLLAFTGLKQLDRPAAAADSAVVLGPGR